MLCLHSQTCWIHCLITMSTNSAPGDSAIGQVFASLVSTASCKIRKPYSVTSRIPSRSSNLRVFISIVPEWGHETDPCWCSSGACQGCETASPNRRHLSSLTPLPTAGSRSLHFPRNHRTCLTIVTPFSLWNNQMLRKHTWQSSLMLRIWDEVSPHFFVNHAPRVSI